jgi:hypothetical protein
MFLNVVCIIRNRKAGDSVQKRYIIAIIVVVISLTTILIMNVQKKHEYETYLKQENEKSISSILSMIYSNNEILKKCEETGEITYAELSRVGSSYLNIEFELIDLHSQIKHFVTKEKYNNENFNTIIRCFDGISLFISMDVLQGIGNYYPHMYNDKGYEMNKDEYQIFGYILNFNEKFINIITEKGFLSNQSNGKQYYIEVDAYNGLGDLIDLIDALAEEFKNYLGELERYENSKLVEEFLFEVK